MSYHVIATVGQTFLASSEGCLIISC